VEGSASQTRAEVAQEPVPIGIGRREHLGPNPKVALGLAILVGLAVFGLLWWVRKTFGMKE
jgi:hypothetical protein